MLPADGTSSFYGNLLATKRGRAATWWSLPQCRALFARVALPWWCLKGGLEASSLCAHHFRSSEPWALGSPAPWARVIRPDWISLWCSAVRQGLIRKPNCHLRASQGQCNPVLNNNTVTVLSLSSYCLSACCRMPPKDTIPFSPSFSFSFSTQRHGTLSASSFTEQHSSLPVKSGYS